MQLLIWKMLFSQYLLIKTTQSRLLSAVQASTTPSLPCLRGTSSLWLCHLLVHNDLDLLSFLQVVTLTPYMDDIVLTEPSEQEVAVTLDLLVRPSHVRGWKIDLTKILGPSTPAKFLDV